MAALDECFVGQVVVPVKIIDIIEDPEQHSIRSNQSNFSTLDELKSHFSNDHNDDYVCRYISICQRNSWKPLQITKLMLDLIVSKYDISSSFWDVPSCFYTRNNDFEEVVCIPYTESISGSVIEISYTVRYPEYKADEEKWVIRQSGIYHRFNTRTLQSVFLLFSPSPRASIHPLVEDFLLNHAKGAAMEPFWLHRILFSTYFPAWRLYMAALEQRFLPIANKTFATYIDAELLIAYGNLSTLIIVQNRFLQIPTILGSATEVLNELSTVFGSIKTIGVNHPGIQQLKNHRRQCIAYSRTATHLQERVQTTAQLLTDTLLMRDQVVAKEQNRHMLQLNKTAVFITSLTLLYLPPSFLASLFGMNFFGFDSDNHRILSTPMIWIFFVSSAVLTAFTFLIFFLRQRPIGVFRNFMLTVRNPMERSWKLLTRRVRSREGKEWQSFQA